MTPARVCSGCGERDPMWSGLPRPGWELVDGKLVCTDCLWMTAGTTTKEPA